MTSNQIIRNIKLHLLSDIKLKEPYLSIYIDIKELFSNMIKYKFSNSLEGKYYGAKGEEGQTHIIYISKRKYLHINIESNDMLRNITTKHAINQKTLKEIIKWYFKNIYL